MKSKWLLFPVLYPPFLAITMMEAAMINLMFYAAVEIDETAAATDVIITDAKLT